MNKPTETEEFPDKPPTVDDLPKPKGPKGPVARVIEPDREYEIFNTTIGRKPKALLFGAHVLPPAVGGSLRMRGKDLLALEKQIEYRLKYGQIEVREARPR